MHNSDADKMDGEKTMKKEKSHNSSILEKEELDDMGKVYHFGSLYNVRNLKIECKNKALTQRQINQIFTNEQQKSLLNIHHTFWERNENLFYTLA